MSTPPPVGKTLSVKVDAQLYDDLETMLRSGMTVSDAVRTAVSIVAGTYRNAWAMGVIPDGKMPHITTCVASGYDDDGTFVPLGPTVGPTPRPAVTPPGTTPPAPRSTPVRRGT
jgi:hypothetical protein